MITSATANSTISVDVFDTVLTRPVGEPAALFVLLGRRLNRLGMLKIEPERFASLRVEAERVARQFEPSGQPTFEQIYRKLGNLVPLSRPIRARVAAMERDLEAELIRPVPGADRWLRELRRTAGGRLIFLSEMYLDSAFIRKLLSRFGLIEPQDECFVSCELGCGKQPGKLFAEVCRRRSIHAARLVHYGNSGTHDVDGAARAGAVGLLRADANLNRYERLLEAHASSCRGGLASVLAGASRLARLATPADGEHEAALRDVAAGVVAPTLVGFILWLLRQSTDVGLQRLYFLSRDGQIMLHIARRLVAALKVPIELRYLYASRQAWHLPAMQSVTRQAAPWLIDNTEFLSVRSILRRVGLDPEQASAELASIDLGSADWDRNLDPPERSRLKNLLLGGSLDRAILASAASARESAVEYLLEQGLADGASWAIVDIGWHGRLQQSLASLGRSRWPSPRGFYFGLYDRCPDAGAMAAYLFEEPLRPAPVGEIHALMEMMTAGDHGLVLGYARGSGGLNPVLHSPANEAVCRWGLPVIRRTVDAFLDHLVIDEELVDAWADVRAATADLLRAFWLRPTRAEAFAWGRFPYEDDQSASSRHPLAEPYRWPHVWRALRTRRLVPLHRCFWQAGALAISNPAVSLAVRGIRQARIMWDKARAT